MIGINWVMGKKEAFVTITTMTTQVLEINIFCPIIRTYTNKSLFLLYVFYGSLVDAKNWILEIRRPC